MTSLQRMQEPTCLLFDLPQDTAEPQEPEEPVWLAHSLFSLAIRIINQVNLLFDHITLSSGKNSLNKLCHISEHINFRSSQHLYKACS